jgi:hypothetical protein
VQRLVAAAVAKLTPEALPETTAARVFADVGTGREPPEDAAVAVPPSGAPPALAVKHLWALAGAALAVTAGVALSSRRRW